MDDEDIEEQEDTSTMDQTIDSKENNNKDQDLNSSPRLETKNDRKFNIVNEDLNLDANIVRKQVSFDKDENNKINEQQQLELLDEIRKLKDTNCEIENEKNVLLVQIRELKSQINE